MVQLSATRCSCIAVLWVSLVSFAAITLCVCSQRVFIVVSVYLNIDSVRKLLDTRSYHDLIFTVVKTSNSPTVTWISMTFPIILHCIRFMQPKHTGTCCCNYLHTESRDSSVGICWATGWTIGVLGFDFRPGLGNFLFITASRTALGPPSLLSNRYQRLFPGSKADGAWSWPLTSI
jgi:hypothetical protein